MKIYKLNLLKLIIAKNSIVAIGAQLITGMELSNSPQWRSLGGVGSLSLG